MNKYMILRNKVFIECIAYNFPTEMMVEPCTISLGKNEAELVDNDFTVFPNFAGFLLPSNSAETE